MESFTLYIAEDCHDCERVTDHLAAHNFSLKTFNYDTDQRMDDWPQLYAFPALCEGDRILAYGIDIIDYIDKKRN